MLNLRILLSRFLRPLTMRLVTSSGYAHRIIELEKNISEIENLVWTSENRILGNLYFSKLRNLNTQVIKENSEVLNKSQFISDSNCGLIAIEDYDVVISTAVRRNGCWEKEIAKWLTNNLKEGDTFINVGANVGIHSITASFIVGKSGKIIALEPNSATAERLRLNCLVNDVSNIQIFKFAASDKNGNATLFTSNYNSGDNRLMFDADLQGSVCETETLRLSDFLLLHDLNPNVILIDVQGHELEVLSGLITNAKSQCKIVFEFTPVWARNNLETAITDLGSLIKGKFELFQITSDGCEFKLNLESLNSQFVNGVQDLNLLLVPIS